MSTTSDIPGGGLGPEARALLDAAREGLSPDAAAVRRVHARIHVATGGAAAAGTALGVKLALIALVAAGVVAGVVVAGRRGPAAVPPGVERVDRTAPVLPAAPAVPAAPAEAAGHAAAPASDEDLITLEPVPRPVRPAARAVPGPAPAVAPAHPPAGDRIALGREVELVDQAMAALRRGDPGAALRVTQDYAREAAGGGQLAEDAAAIEVEALCVLGDPAAGERRARFDARFPRSAQRARLAAACR